MSQETSAKNKRIAQNSIYMAIRMVIVLGIMFYTTRISLSVLGVEDYGVYNVVCGFVTMFAFLNTSMSNGIQRFYNFELGKNGVEGAKNVFNTALFIQAIIAVVIVLFTEAFGIWYINNEIVVPDGRILAAHCIFQFSILSFLFVIFRAPFGAAITAHERMDFTALLSVIDAVLKLGIVFLVPIFDADQLILYGALMALIEVLNFVISFVYARKNFKEISLSMVFNKKMFRTMIGFSGWNLFGSLSGVMKEQGINLVLNLFCGPVVNAARGVANQINGGLQSFVNNLTIPVRPQVIQSYAAGNTTRTMNLTFSVSKLSCCFMYIIALPIILEIDTILKLWLGDNIPEHASTFAVIVILISFVNNLNSAISGVVHASGKMRDYQVYTSIIALMCVPLSYILLKLGAQPEYALLMILVSVILAQTASLFILKKIVNYSVMDYVRSVLKPFAMLVLSSILLPVLAHIYIEMEIMRLIMVTILSLTCSIPALYFLSLNYSEKQLIDSFIRKIIRK